MKEKFLSYIRHFNSSYFYLGLSAVFFLIMLGWASFIAFYIYDELRAPEKHFVTYQFTLSDAEEEPILSDNALPEVGNEALIEQDFKGPLPKIASTGLTPFQYYAAPFDKEAHPKSIALAISFVDLDPEAIYPLIKKLPDHISVILSPYVEDLQKVIAFARAYGHEVFISLPLESFDPIHYDQGPETLFIHRSPSENKNYLKRLMAKAQGYAGFINLYGERFVVRENQMRPLLKELASRGLGFIDASDNLRSLTGALSKQMAIKTNLRLRPGDQIDDSLDLEVIVNKLMDAQAIAQKGGEAILLLSAYPGVIEQLRIWEKGLTDGIVIAPISSRFLPKITLNPSSKLDKEEVQASHNAEPNE